MFYCFFNYVKSGFSLYFLAIGLIKLCLYKIQYSNRDVTWGEHIEVKGKFFLRFNGCVRLGDNLVFNGMTRFNVVGVTKECSIFVKEGAKLSIGNHSGFSGVSLVCYNRIDIGEYCNFGGNVSIWDTDFHPLSYVDRRVHNEEKIVNKPILIGNDVFVGANSIILKGVTIGDRAIIGAGSVVTCNIPPNEIWAGNPARFIKVCC